jgi:hypothetical protein
LHGERVQLEPKCFIKLLDGLRRTASQCIQSLCANTYVSGSVKTARIILPCVILLATLSAQNAYAQSAPTITPGTGVYFPGPSVTISGDSGDTFYYTTDGSTPTTSSLVYSSAFTVGATATVNAIAVDGSGDSSSVSTAYINVDPALQILPTRVTPILWLRSDTGVASDPSSGAVNSWLDLSGNGNNATQSNSSNQPVVVNNDCNGFPGVSFSSSGSQFLNLPSDFAAFNTGAAVFIVTNPPWWSDGNVIDLGNGNDSDNLTVSDSGTTGTFTIVNGSSPESLSSSSALTNGQYQLLEAWQDGSSQGYLLNNGTETGNGSLQSANNITRTVNHIGTDYSEAANFYDGNFAEMLVYEKSPGALYSQSQLESYAISRYQLLNAVPEDPIISVPTTTLTAPEQVAIYVPADCICYYTTDGSTPDPGSSPVYTQPITVSYSQTVQAISVKNNVQSPDVVSATYTLDSNQWPAPDPTDTTDLQLNIQSPAN